MARFISYETLRERSIINGNVDHHKINPIIDECQEMHILPILGTGLYNQVSAQISAGNVSALNKTLLNDYIQPCLIKYIESEATMYLNFNFTNANVSTKNTDESVPVSMADAEKMMYRLRNKAEWFGERITKYLREKSNDYPLYFNPGNGSDIIHPQKTNYTSGMYLGGDDCGCDGYTNNKTSPQ